MSVTEESNRCDIVGSEETNRLDSSLTDDQINRLDVTVKDETNRYDLSPRDESLNRSDNSLKEESNESIDGKDYTQVSDGSDSNLMRQAFVDTTAMAIDREFMYKLMISQLLYDGHRNVAIVLSNSEKLKHLVQPSQRLHHLLSMAFKTEGDSPLSDDSIHAMNLIDLDYEVDHNSSSSRASFYDTSTTKDYFRSRSYSPDTELMPLPHRMHGSHDLIGRMISKTSPLADTMQSMTHLSTTDSIGSRPGSTPDIPIQSFGQINNGLRSITPNAGDITSQTSLLGNSAQDINISDLLQQINLAQFMYMNGDPTASVASSTAANTPSPTPIPPSVPLDNGGLVLNEAALKNISQLAKLSANEGQNGLSISNSTSPTCLTSPIGRSVSNTGTKPNTMQIRCKFGQLGQQKGQFSSPHGFCLGVDEEIVIADTNNHRICVFDKSAEFKHSFGVPGKDEAQLWYPRKIAIIRNGMGGGTGNTAPRYVICDRGAERSRMQIFTRSGHFVRKIAIRYIDIVAGLAITPQGHIVAVDSVSPTVFVIAESGDLLRWFDCSEYMREPSDIAINNHEYYICDFKAHCVVVFSDEGQYLRKIGSEGLTSFPNGIDISDAGDILVGDSHGNRFHVVVFDRSGTLISEFECPYVKVSRCCGLKITSEGYVVTLAKNNHHVLILNTLYIM
ncbi:uncharacterized protein LOC128962996 [Oppia nitens]|uniref:uncharacterized protein LOC128962996 n=1 Tax=Oppia nitens TaxID=1686743 RepID=UPI0023DA7307|nr:uncharacterized protein LOC128962996 [Oppia nitens]